MYCRECGWRISREELRYFKFCPECGHPLEADREANQTASLTDKLKGFHSRLKQYLEECPDGGLRGGIIASAAGAGLYLLSKPVIGIGSAIAGFGSGIMVFGIMAAGAGMITGIVGGSQELIKKLAITGAAITGAGALTIVGGVLLKGIGYLMLPAGGIITLAGLGLLGIAAWKRLTKHCVWIEWAKCFTTSPETSII